MGEEAERRLGKAISIRIAQSPVPKVVSTLTIRQVKPIPAILPIFSSDPRHRYDHTIRSSAIDLTPRQFVKPNDVLLSNRKRPANHSTYELFSREFPELARPMHLLRIRWPVPIAWPARIASKSNDGERPQDPTVVL